MQRLADPASKRLLRFWAATLGLVAVELLLVLLHVGWLTPFVSLLVAGLIVFVPMELSRAPNLALTFALAGLFWLVVVLFGLGTLDPLTRHDQPSVFRSEP